MLRVDPLGATSLQGGRDGAGIGFLVWGSSAVKEPEG
jgi:hypothetical protein